MIHICPTEIAIVAMIIDNTKYYLFHIKHILISFFTNWYNKDCKICNKKADDDKK